MFAKLKNERHTANNALAKNGAGPLRLIFYLTCNFRSSFNLVGWAGPAMNSPYFANALLAATVRNILNNFEPTVNEHRRTYTD